MAFSKAALFLLQVFAAVVSFVDAETAHGRQSGRYRHWKHRLRLGTWPKVGIALGFLLIVVVMIGVYLYRRRRHRLAEAAAALVREQEMTQQTLARRAFIESFPVQVYFPPEDGEIDHCAICILDFDEGSSLRLLPCCHRYHIGCFDLCWQLGRPTVCPLCRRDYGTWQPEGGPPAN